MTQSDSRRRFLETTARLLRERGFAATGMADVVAESGAPKGSLYFHFPGGKEELFAAAIAHSGEQTCAGMKAALEGNKTTQRGLEAIMAYLAASLEGSDFRAGCPVGTVAAEAPDAPQVREGVARVFTNWHDIVKARLVEAGLKPRRAGELAEFILAVIEGAIVLAKARKSTEPVETAKRELARILRNEGIQ
ncbi:TetR/AcrR family transcriptional regulator [Pendulispora brunnea]|uniref:TetR/AcrR family transcriptional regulator n=1 Tax=Pendulispora brunnea TaxID=2905690 RepID=A0ABZ2KMC0_9BACT